MNPPRILHLIHSMNPADGGPPEVVRQLALASRDNGTGMEILCQDYPESSFLKSLPCPVHAVYAGKSTYGYSRELRRWLEANISRFDGLILHCIWQYVNVAGGLVARDRGVPYLVFAHGALDPWFKQRYPLKHLKKHIYWPLCYLVMKQAKAVIFTGAGERDLAGISFKPNRWTSRIVPLGITAPEAQPERQTEAFFAQMPGMRGRRFLLYLGRIHEKKGCDLLIQAFIRVSQQYPDIHLVMAGPDQVGMRAGLQSMAEAAGISSRVHWPGLVLGDAKQGAYRAADAFILPSHQENFGMSIAESLACGTPVLISNQVEIWKDIEREGAGLVEADTLEGTEQLLQKWLGMNEAGRDEMAARAFRCFEKHYSIKTTLRAIEEIFGESSHGKDVSDMEESLSRKN